MTFQVNHIAPFLLTNLLLDRLTKAAEGARVISTASTAYPHLARQLWERSAQLTGVRTTSTG
jgi:NAD(P)-dependent dehydrogenase (short-subunit alcohol dehydrogenase family)